MEESHGELKVSKSPIYPMSNIYTHNLSKSHNLSTRCVHNMLVASLSTSCDDVVILSSCYKVVTHNLLNSRAITICWNSKSAVGLLQLVRFYVCIRTSKKNSLELIELFSVNKKSQLNE